MPSLIPFIDYLQQKGVFDLVNAFTTVVLALFAFVQLQQVSSQRRIEKRTAYGALWVEFWRMWTVSENWRTQDLFTRANMDAFDPDEIRPKDSGALLPFMGLLGAQTARFGGSAFATSANAALCAKHLLQLLKLRKEQLERAETYEQKSAVIAEYKNAVDSSIAEARRLSRDAAILFEDALKSAPKWLQVEEINLDGLDSTMAAGLRTHLAAAPKPLAGNIGRPIGRSLKRLANRFDP